MNIQEKTLISVDKKDVADGVLVIPEGVEHITAREANKDYIDKIILPESMVDLRMQSEYIHYENVVGDPSNYMKYDGVFEECYAKSIVLSPHTKEIGENCFKNSELEHIDIPDEVTVIGSEAFSGSSIVSISIPKVKKIENNAFTGCYKLISIILPDELEDIPSGYTKYLGGDYTLDNIWNAHSFKGAFEGCRLLENISLPANLNKIDTACFKKCTSLKQIDIPEKVTEIGKNAFEGCESLKKVIIPKSVKNVGEELFKDCTSLEYVNIPNEELANLGKMVNYTSVAYDENAGVVLEKKEKVNKDNKYIPAQYLAQLIEGKSIKQFLENSDFRAFNSNIENIKSLMENNNASNEEQFDFFKFAASFGCFSKEQFLDKNGVPTEATIGQKASALFAQLIKNEGFQFGDFHGLFDSLSMRTKANQHFIKFLTPQGKDFGNLNLLLDMEHEHPGIFAKVMANFDEVEKYRIRVDDNGKNKTVPWNEAIMAYYYSEKYQGINEENRDIALEYSSHGMEQKIFNKAVDLRHQAKEQNIPEHILGKELKEKTILQQIEELQSRTEEQLMDAKTIVDELYKKSFTYEWLSKNDAKNGIMGIYTSCCANLKSSFYGKHIAENTIIAKDVQNLIVRNNEGRIVAKGTIYVNEENGYAVFNDFEINEQFKANQVDTEEDYEYGGLYTGDDKTEEELTESDLKKRKDRDMIFGALMRGMNAFIEEYDKQHPDKPMIQVNVGMGYNRLKRNVKEFCEVATENLTVPAEYCFEDAAYKQYVLYVNEIAKEKIEKEAEQNKKETIEIDKEER